MLSDVKLNHHHNHVYWKIYPLVILLDRTSDFEGGPNVHGGSPSHLQLHHLQGAKRRQNICSRDGRGAKTSENICWQKASLYFGFEMTETGVNHAVQVKLYCPQHQRDLDLEVGVRLDVVLIEVGLDLGIVAVDASFQVALLLVVWTLTSTQHLEILIRFLVGMIIPKETRMTILMGTRMAILMGREQDVHLDGDQVDHLCLVDHLPEGKKLLASNLPVF